MLKKRVFELLNQEVDGTNSAKEHQEVKTLLAKNAEARRTFDALKELASFLKATPQVEPPSSLKKRILASLPNAKPSPQKLFPLFPVIRMFTEGTNIRYAYTFAGGAVAGILLFAFLTGSPSDTSTLVGTIGSPAPQTIHSAEIDFPEVRGTFAAEAVENNVIATATFKTTEEIEFIVRFDEAQLQFDHSEASGQSSGTVSPSAGRLELKGSGPMVYKFFFSRKSADAVALNADILIDGAKRSEVSLTLEQRSH